MNLPVQIRELTSRQKWKHPTCPAKKIQSSQPTAQKVMFTLFWDSPDQSLRNIWKGAWLNCETLHDKLKLVIQEQMPGTTARCYAVAWQCASPYRVHCRKIPEAMLRDLRISTIQPWPWSMRFSSVSTPLTCLWGRYYVSSHGLRPECLYGLSPCQKHFSVMANIHLCNARQSVLKIWRHYVEKWSNYKFCIAVMLLLRNIWWTLCDLPS
jgi:hypothetical protein